jgi:hypothetical protein
VADLGAEVEDVRPPLDGVEVLAEVLPLPRDAFGHRRAGDVLDALHQLDQPLAAVGAGGREPDTAVAHHRGRHAVPRRRRQPLVPAGLGVVVGVDVDEPRRDEAPVGIELVASGSVDARLDRRHDAVVDGDVGVAAGCSRSVDDEAVADHRVMAHPGESRRRRDEDDVVRSVADVTARFAG